MAQGVVWQRVGTALSVRPVILPGNQIRVTPLPVISYFTPGGGGTIEVAEATELVVPNGGRTSSRQVLGYRTERSTRDTALTLTAIIQ